MKKIYSLAILLTMLIGIGFNASAVKATFEWEIPGSVSIRTGSASGPLVELTADQTSYTFETESTFAYCYVFANDGYIIMPSQTSDGSNTYAPIKPYGATAKCLSITVNSALNGKTILVNCAKLERDDEFTVNVENGLGDITATFDSGYTLDLKDGSNKYAFNPSIDDPLTVSLTGVAEAYSITLNDEPLTKNQYYARYDNINVQPGDVLYIRVYETAPVDCTLTIDYADGLEGCLKNIRNWSKSSFITPDAIVDNKITVTAGTDLQFNLESDYDYTAFYLGDEDITSKFNESNNSIRFIVSEDCTLKIVGAPKVHEMIPFTAYIMNPEGVNLKPNRYGAEPAELGEGETIDSPITISGFSMSTDATRKFTVDVDAETPNVYIAPKDGWYIATVQGNEEGALSVIDHASEESSTFYVVALPLTGEYPVTFNVDGNKSIKLLGSGILSRSWNNPEREFSLSTGEQTVKFIPGYDLPFTLRATALFDNFQAYLDGMALTPDDNGAFAITPYYPASADDNDKVSSTVTVYANGTSGGRVGRVTLKVNDGLTAQMLYSPVRHAATSPVSLLRGTEMAIVPSTKDCYIKLGDEYVHGYDADGNYINGLNEAGEYVFTITDATATVTVGAQNVFAITSVDPADGATVKSISEVKVTVPMIDEMGEKMPYPSMEKLAEVTLTREGSEPAYVTELGETGMTDDGMGFVFPLIFETITEAGEYTLNIPAGAFVESAWDNTDYMFAPVDGGATSLALTATYTVDPNAKAKIDNYTINPADGATVKSLSVAYLTMPEYGPYDMFQIEDETATFSNGSVTYNAMIGYDWENYEARSFMIIPCTENYEEVTLTEAGEWTLNIAAGTFSFQGESSQEITSTFTIDPSYPAYPMTPAPGSVTGSLAKLTISFPGAYEVEYNETQITLAGDDNDFKTTTYYVSGLTEFDIQFTTLPSEAGEYTVTIPAGAFTIDGEPSEEVIAHYTYKPAWVLDPADGATVENLEEITISFPEAENVEFVGNEMSFVLSVGGSYSAPGLDCEQISANSFKLSIPEGAQVPPTGWATFRIEDGTFVADGEVIGEIRASYIISRSVSTEWTASPNKTIVYADYGFFWAFIFDESATVSYPDRSKIKVNFCGEDLTAAEYEVSCEGYMLLMQITDEALIKAGELKVDIEAGAFTLSGTPISAISYTWNVVAPKEYTYEVSPAADAKVNDLSKITLSFPEAETAVLFNNMISLRSSDYSYYGIPTITEVENAEVPTFELTFDPAPTAAGTYELTGRFGTFTLDGAQQSPEIYVEYDFDAQSGIAGIAIDGNTTVTVVTIDGRVIAKDAPASVIKNLAKGFYIINGAKVLIK